MITIGLASSIFVAHAATPTKLRFTPTSGDAVQLSISAEAERQIQLSYLPPGEPVLRTIVLGTTDTKGSYATTISSGGYGIPAGSPAFVTVSGVQSPMTLWPTYTNSLTLNKTSVQLAVGQSVTVGGSAALILAANSQSTSISTSLSGSQVTITGRSSGSGTIILCAMNVGCSSIAVEVGAQTGQTQIAFSPDIPVYTVGQSSTIVILGGGTNGYSLSSNSNPTVLEAKLSGGNRVLYVYASAAGSSTVKICSLETPTNCSTLLVTVLDNAVQNLTFTPTSLTLIPGLTQSTTVSGGVDNKYYISSNTNSSAAQASLSGAVVTVVGGSTAGSTVITVCSATTNNRCGTFTVTLNTTTSTSSSNALMFSQNVVTVPVAETTNVTVTGGNNSGYSISSNSNSNVVTATVNGSSNIVNLTGNAVGTSIVAVCSTSAGSTCASIYVTVTASLSTLILSQDTASLTPGSKVLISITGGSSATTINSNTNPTVATATLSSNGGGVVVSGGTTAGTTVITVCPTDTYTSKCTSIRATTTVAASIGTTPATLPTVKTPVAPLAKAVALAKVKITGTLMLNVRKSNSTKSSVVTTVNKDQVFTVLEEKGGWYKIQASAKVAGWVSGAYAVKQ